MYTVARVAASVSDVGCRGGTRESSGPGSATPRKEKRRKLGKDAGHRTIPGNPRQSFLGPNGRTLQVCPSQAESAIGTLWVYALKNNPAVNRRLDSFPPSRSGPLNQQRPEHKTMVKTGSRCAHPRR